MYHPNHEYLSLIAGHLHAASKEQSMTAKDLYALVATLEQAIKRLENDPDSDEVVDYLENALFFLRKLAFEKLQNNTEDEAR
jgi:hypothetical protein